MADNKFISRLKGTETTKSVVEVQNDKLVAPFTNVPNSTDVVGGIIDDKDTSIVVAKSAQNWKLNGSSLAVASVLSGDGNDYTGEYNVSGAGLWVDAVYTFPTTGDPRHPVAEIFNASTKWVLKLCGKNLLTSSGNTIDFTLLVKIGTSNITTKTFKIAEGANAFCRQFVIDFSESEQQVIKAQGGANLTLQLLCADSGASATIYNGMTVLSALQRRVDASAVSASFANVEEALQDGILPSDYFDNTDFIDQVDDGEDAYAVFTRDGDTINLSGWTPKDEIARREEVIIKSATIPTASADFVGAIYQYVGTTTSPYQHGYIYECKTFPVDTLVFTPNSVSCSWSDLSAFLQGETQDYDDVVSGTMTYMADADLWALVAKDENNNTVLTYQQYTDDWENLGFTFTGTFADGDVISFVRATTATYGWERIDIQPNTAVWGGITGIITNQTDLVSYIATQIGTVQTQVDTINSKIPSQASAANQLADKNFVNSSIATSTATFRGTYNTLAELEAQQADDNDYGFVIETDAVGNTVYNRYKYNGTAWVFEYALNNSSFTANQWSAINSGITSADVALIATALQSGDNVSELYNDAGYITSASLSNYLTTNTVQTISAMKTTTAHFKLEGLNAVISAGANALQEKAMLQRISTGTIVLGNSSDPLKFYGSGIRPNYGDNESLALLSDIPTVNDATLTIQQNGTDVATFTANSATATTANIIVPTATSDLQNDSGFITNAVNNLVNYTLSSALATVATSGQYSDLTGKPTLGTAAAADVSDFATAAQGAKADTALQAGNNVSLLTNDAGYLTSHQSLADLGITATAAEINTLDGIIATTAELNYVSGVSSSIQTQLNGKQATISDLGTIRTNASNGASAYTTIQGYGNIVSHNASEFATSAQGALADTALQSGDNISELVNDTGYLTSLALSGLTDTNISSPAQGQILMWDGTQWVNSTSTSSIAWGGITGTLSDQSDLNNALNAKQDASTAVIHAANTQVGDTSTPVYIAADGTATACATDFDMGSITGVLDNWFDMGTIN